MVFEHSTLSTQIPNIIRRIVNKFSQPAPSRFSFSFCDSPEKSLSDLSQALLQIDTFIPFDFRIKNMATLKHRRLTSMAQYRVENRRF